MTKKLILLFILCLGCKGYSAQEIGNGTLTHLLTLPAFEEVIKILQGNYLLEMGDIPIPFTLTEEGDIKSYFINEKIEKIKLYRLESPLPIATLMFDIHLAIVKGEKNPSLKLITPHIHLYKKNSDTNTYESIQMYAGERN